MSVCCCSLAGTVACDHCQNRSMTFEYSTDVAPVRRGKWIEKDDGFGDTYYDCSCCGESFCLIEGTPTDNMYNYCPNCGADMRGGT